jgi:glycosyltransferase involved in cell wall biosynthesis
MQHTDNRKIVLYFANSSSGGGAVRLGHYQRLMKNPNCRFIVNKRLSHGFEMHDSRVIRVQPNYFQRLLNENGTIKRFDFRQSILFSHGAPLTPDVEEYVLHINNALPLVTESVTLTLGLKAKMKLLERRLFNSAKQADIVTVESQATRDLIRQKWGNRIADKCKILTNGVDPIALSFSRNNTLSAPFVLTIGTYPYKRLDKVKDFFQEIKREYPDLSLVIVGATEYFQCPDKNYIQYSNLSYTDTRYLIANCSIYITMSEIENCSISLLEAIYHCRPIICSDIPAHVEFLLKYNYQIIEAKKGVLRAEPPINSTIQVPTWTEIVRETFEILDVQH